MTLSGLGNYQRRRDWSAPFVTVSESVSDLAGYSRLDRRATPIRLLREQVSTTRCSSLENINERLWIVEQKVAVDLPLAIHDEAGVCQERRRHFFVGKLVEIWAVRHLY